MSLGANLRRLHSLLAPVVYALLSLGHHVRKPLLSPQTDVCPSFPMLGDGIKRNLSPLRHLSQRYEKQFIGKCCVWDVCSLWAVCLTWSFWEEGDVEVF